MPNELEEIAAYLRRVCDDRPVEVDTSRQRIRIRFIMRITFEAQHDDQGVRSRVWMDRYPLAVTFPIFTLLTAAIVLCLLLFLPQTLAKLTAIPVLFWFINTARTAVFAWGLGFRLKGKNWLIPSPPDQPTKS